MVVLEVLIGVIIMAAECPLGVCMWCVGCYVLTVHLLTGSIATSVLFLALVYSTYKLLPEPFHILALLTPILYTVEPPIKDAPNKGHDSEPQTVTFL